MFSPTLNIENVESSYKKSAAAFIALSSGLCEVITRIICKQWPSYFSLIVVQNDKVTERYEYKKMFYMGAFMMGAYVLHGCVDNFKVHVS